MSTIKDAATAEVRLATVEWIFNRLTASFSLFPIFSLLSNQRTDKSAATVEQNDRSHQTNPKEKTNKEKYQKRTKWLWLFAKLQKGLRAAVQSSIQVRITSSNLDRFIKLENFYPCPVKNKVPVPFFIIAYIPEKKINHNPRNLSNYPNKCFFFIPIFFINKILISTLSFIVFLNSRKEFQSGHLKPCVISFRCIFCHSLSRVIYFVVMF